MMFLPDIIGLWEVFIRIQSMEHGRWNMGGLENGAGNNDFLIIRNRPFTMASFEHLR